MLGLEAMKIKAGLQNMNKIIYVLALLMDTWLHIFTKTQ